MNSNIVSFALVACSLVALSVSAPAPSGVPLALSTPLVAPAPAAAVISAAPVLPAPAVVTAYSSQYVARNYNGIAVAPAVVPSAAYISYPQVYAPSYTGPLVEEYLF